MIKIESIALTAALFGATHAAGCFPAYVSGTEYDSGDQVSVTSTVTTTTTEQCELNSAGCGPSGFKTTTTSVTSSYNYQCVDGAYGVYCKSPDFNPDGIHGSVAWTQESAECTGAAGSQATTTAAPPQPWSGAGCPEAYAAGTSYDAADTVSSGGLVYECAAAPNNLFCGQAGYEPGTGDVWTILGSCTGSMAPTGSPAFTTLTDMGGCPSKWAAGATYEEGDKVSSGGLVFECRAFPFSSHCGQAGYEPISEANGEAWKDAWTVAGYCDGTISPTSAPSFDPANVSGCPVAWAAGNQDAYVGDDLVSVVVQTTPEVKFVYKCKDWPFSGFCGQFSPIADGGDQGWEIVGKCEGSISPTSSPTFDSVSLVSGGCPGVYDKANTSYEAGDAVSYVASTSPPRTLVYECKPYPYNGYCNNEAFAPGTDNVATGWDLKGYCEGTISPTVSPTAYANDPLASVPAECEAETAASGSVDTCYYTKDVTTEESCTCSDSDCPNPNGLTGSACTKEVTVTHCPTVASYSATATYAAGDVVRVGTKRFKCKEWPFYLWCGNAYYAPTGEDYGDAWSTDGDCPPPLP
mmetsp:Transcript_29431/g.66001  ORF Transcript_29431/g.66001 Transcript_29431/m.66001 type:complete len:578 (+) Transcript_29431:313-2046(+)